MILPKLLSQTALGVPLLLSALGVTISRCHFTVSTVLPLTAVTFTSINACGFSHWRPTRVPLRSMHLVASNWTPNEWCANAGTATPRANTAVKTPGSFTLIKMSPFGMLRRGILRPSRPWRNALVNVGGPPVVSDHGQGLLSRIVESGRRPIDIRTDWVHRSGGRKRAKRLKEAPTELEQEDGG